MAKKKEQAETAFAIWSMTVQEADHAVFRGERRWWRWPLRKSAAFLLGYTLLGLPPLVGGAILSIDSVYTLDGTQVIQWGKLLLGTILFLVSFLFLLWFSFKGARVWQARPGQLSIEEQTWKANKVKALHYGVKHYISDPDHDNPEAVASEKMMHIYLELTDGSMKRLDGFYEQGMTQARSAVKTLGQVAGIEVIRKTRKTR